VRDAADDVAAQAHRLAHELLAVREAQDPVLGEGDQPEVDDVADLLAQLEEGLERDEVRIADVDVAADEAGALGDLPADRLTGAILDVLVGERGLPLGPGEDPLDERAGLVVARLADGQDGIQMNVRIDERRRQQPAAGVELPVAACLDRAGRGDRRDPIAVGQQVDESRRLTRGRGRRRVGTRVPDEQTRGGLPLPTWSRAMLVRATPARLSDLHRPSGLSRSGRPPRS
jgi:hypothetical protein